jgi:hypothetical protein
MTVSALAILVYYVPVRPKTVIPQPPGETTMQRLDSMVRTIFAAGKPASNARPEPATRKRRVKKNS